MKKANKSKILSKICKKNKNNKERGIEKRENKSNNLIKELKIND